jgi:2-polyprenyl-3-methyl-5-hydroxy-6-metoxy-1,4-benzoquinol methylase
MSEFYSQANMEGGYYYGKEELLMSLIEDRKDYIDLGCYDGKIADMITVKTDSVVDGVDISANNIRKARNLRNKYVFDLNEQHWPIKESYDYVIATDVIEHLLDIDNFMTNVRLILKDNGYLILTTPNAGSLGRRIFLLIGRNPFFEISKHKEVNCNNAEVVGHIKYFIPQTIRSLMRFYDFEIERFVGIVVDFYFFQSRIIGRLLPNLASQVCVKARKMG